MMTEYAQKFTTKPRFSHHLDMQHSSHVGFFTSLLLWDSAQAKIYKFDFRHGGLVVKSAGLTFH